MISRMNTDIVVVGAGLAGLEAGRKAAANGQTVTFVVSNRFCSGASFYPMMDSLTCQVTADTKEDPQHFFKEMMDTGQGTADPELVKRYVEDIPKRILELPELGITPKVLSDNKVACFATRPRKLVTWGGWCDISKKARSIFSSYSNIIILEFTTVVGVLTKDGVTAGVLTVDRRGEYLWISSTSIVLASGGVGNLFEHNLNSADIAGNGQLFAFRKGAQLTNLEFLQFIPGFFQPVYKIIFREMMLDYTKSLTDYHGNPLLDAYLSIPEQKECLKKRATHGPFTSRGISKYFDIAMFNAIIKGDSPEGIHLCFSEDLAHDSRESTAIHLEWLKKVYQIDILKSPITIAPFYHASNGGVKINVRCETTVPGLFAAGEVAGGMHGSDRHGGIGTGSCLVFGAIAGESAACFAKKNKAPSLSDQQIQDYLQQYYQKGKENIYSPDYVLKTTQHIMWRSANVVRSEQSLTKAIRSLLQLESDYQALAIAQNPIQRKQALKAQNALDMAQLLLYAMLKRPESRGSHYREDFPHPDPAYRHPSIFQCQAGTLKHF